MLDVPHLDAKVKLRTLDRRQLLDPRPARARSRCGGSPRCSKSEGIGFLAALAPKTPPPPGPPAKPEAPGSFFEIVGRRARRSERDLRLPGSWGLELRHAHARASLKQSGVDPDHPTFGFDAGPGGRGRRRLAEDPRRQRAAVRSRRHQPRRDDPGMVRRHLPRPRRGRHRPQQARRPRVSSPASTATRRSRGSSCTPRSPRPATR